VFFLFSKKACSHQSMINASSGYRQCRDLAD
jgi:hypothetical protein